LDALRDKDAALCDALDRTEELEATLARERADRTRVDGRLADTEARLRAETDRANKFDHQLKDLRRDAAQFKGQLAQAQFDSDVAEKKYEALLAKMADEGAYSDIVDRAAKRALEELDARAAAEEKSRDGDETKAPS
jgi:septal ring factor EnvC (AmiA/AmiB activator)